MPVLFAYLIALTLLVGGGYGALNWLVTPEPVKVAAKVRHHPRPTPNYETIEPPLSAGEQPGVESPEANAAAASKVMDEGRRDMTSAASDHAAQISSSPAAPAPTEQKTIEQQRSEAKQIAAVEPGEKPQIRAARAQMASRPKRVVESRAQPASRPTKRQAADEDDDKPVARPRLARVADSAERRGMDRPLRVERRKLALMTLRTIEFSDGTRATRLIPYRDAARDDD
jgi:hypothetical protein